MLIEIFAHSSPLLVVVLLAMALFFGIQASKDKKLKK
tara:strand:- start:3638 stop:3748 length:111 start_codon:yes stop_codon:yes gene_type:complete